MQLQLFIARPDITELIEQKPAIVRKIETVTGITYGNDSQEIFEMVMQSDPREIAELAALNQTIYHLTEDDPKAVGAARRYSWIALGWDVLEWYARSVRVEMSYRCQERIL